MSTLSFSGSVIFFEAVAKVVRLFAKRKRMKNRR
jgi:hypothetical protein